MSTVNLKNVAGDQVPLSSQEAKPRGRQSQCAAPLAPLKLGFKGHRKRSCICWTAHLQCCSSSPTALPVRASACIPHDKSEVALGQQKLMKYNKETCSIKSYFPVDLQWDFTNLQRRILWCSQSLITKPRWPQNSLHCWLSQYSVRIWGLHPPPLKVLTVSINTLSSHHIISPFFSTSLWGKQKLWAQRQGSNHKTCCSLTEKTIEKSQEVSHFHHSNRYFTLRWTSKCTFQTG